MIGFIYYLRNPINDDIFYVGCTRISLKHRLRQHYQHLREAELGKRKMNKRFTYMRNMGETKPTIHLLEIVAEYDLDEKEAEYIARFRKAGYNLTNGTDGGSGGNTAKYFSDAEKIMMGEKLSHANKGKAKPKGFAENMSKARMGVNNPGAGTGKYGWLLCADDYGNMRLFKYAFEVNKFTSRKDGNAMVLRACKRKIKSYGLWWYFYNDCDDDLKTEALTTYQP